MDGNQMTLTTLSAQTSLPSIASEILSRSWRPPFAQRNSRLSMVCARLWHSLDRVWAGISLRLRRKSSNAPISAYLYCSVVYNASGAACPECSILRKELEAARQERDRARQEADQWRSKLLEYLKAPAEAAAELAQSSIAPTTVNPL